jgi:hypothetical protein
MKCFLIALLVVSGSISASAQKHTLYADAGVSFSSGAKPGFSLTYNYKFAKHFGVGIGVQGYDFAPTTLEFHQFIPAVFVDLRLLIRPVKENQFFSFLDLGIDFYDPSGKYNTSGNPVIAYTPQKNGFYSGLGAGYFRRMTKRGCGPYASLKTILNWNTMKGYDYSKGKNITTSSADGTFVFSLGFRF